MINRTTYFFSIGIDKYSDNSWDNLANAVSDTQKVADLLINDYGVKVIGTLENKAATRANIITKLKDVGKFINPEDNLIIYFAGHGYLEEFSKTKSKGYWVPYDGGKDDTPNYISNSTVRDIIEVIEAKHIFLIIDSCYSGAFFKGKSRGRKKSHIEKLDKDNSRWALASGRLEVVSDGRKGETSPFAKHLIAILSKNIDKHLRVGRIIEYVKEETGSESDEKQLPRGEPISDVGHQGGELILIKQKLENDKVLLQSESTNPANLDLQQPILNQIYDYIDFLYQELNFVPLHLLSRYYPFNSTQTFSSYYSNFTIYTDNPLLFNLFKSVEIINDGEIIITNKGFIKGIKNWRKKIKYVLIYLTRNLVYKIVNIKDRETAYIGYFHYPLCRCLSCLFSRFEIKKIAPKLKKDPTTLKNKMELAYLNYKMGNYLWAVNLFEDALDIAKKENKKISKFIISKNLHSLYSFIRHDYFGEHRKFELEQKLKNIDLKSLYCEFNKSQDKQVLNWLVENKFYNSSLKNVLHKFNQIRDSYHTHLYSNGRSMNNFISELYEEYAKARDFINRNYIIFDKTSQFSQLKNLLFEGVYSSFGTRGDKASKVKRLGDWIMCEMLHYGDSNKLIKYYNVYKIEELIYNPDAIHPEEQFTSIVLNLFSNLKSLINSKRRHFDKDNKSFWTFYSQITNNALCLISQIKTTPAYINELSNRIIEFSLISNSREPLKYIKYFILNKGTLLSKNELLKFLLLVLKKERFQKSDYWFTVTNMIKKYHKNISIDTDTFSEIEIFIYKTAKDNKKNNLYLFIVAIYTIIDNEKQKKIITQMIEESLLFSFDSELFYYAVIYNLLPLEGHFLSQYLSITIPELSSSSKKINQNRFHKLDNLLNLCFKKSINIQKGKYSKIQHINDYYNWLVNMDDFDYNKFLPDWITEYSTMYYSKRIYNSSKTKNAIVEYLKKKHDPKIERHFINIFIIKAWSEKD